MSLSMIHRTRFMALDVMNETPTCGQVITILLEANAFESECFQ